MTNQPTTITVDVLVKVDVSELIFMDWTDFESLVEEAVAHEHGEGCISAWYVDVEDTDGETLVLRVRGDWER